MSLINKNNYEAFMLDYMEQNLSVDMVAELMLFFEQNPELKHELEELYDMALPSNQVIFNDKDKLKKEAIANLMIAEIEGLNTSAESNELKNAIKKDQENEKAFLLYQKTILKPANVVFKDKASLKQEQRIIPMYWRAASVAAILIAFFLIRNLNTDSVHETQNNFADSKEIEANTLDNTIKEQPIIIEDELLNNKKSELAEEIKSTPVNVKEKKVTPIIKKEPEVENSNMLAEVEEQEMNIETDSITIMPAIYEDEILLAENKTSFNKVEKDEPISVGQFLKSEVQKTVLKEEEPTPNKKAEIMVVDLLAKVAGKKARVDKTKNKENEVEQYALNIGGFSFSKKIRK